VNITSHHIVSYPIESSSINRSCI